MGTKLAHLEICYRLLSGGFGENGGFIGGSSLSHCSLSAWCSLVNEIHLLFIRFFKTILKD